MPIYNKTEAKEGGWAQVRAALLKFEGDVISSEPGQWGGVLMKDDGTPAPPREFMEFHISNMHVLEVSEDLSMDVEGQEYNFRINCSDAAGSFWVAEFLESADKFKVLLPDGLTGKRVTFEKKTRLANKRKDGSPGDPKYNSTGYVIAGVGKIGAVAIKAEAAPVQAAPTQTDPMLIALDLAVGKTETQFRTAIALNPVFANNAPLLSLAKAGMITASFVKDGKLVEVQEGAKKVYRKV